MNVFYCFRTQRRQLENRGARIIATEEPENINPRKSGGHFKRFLRGDPSENDSDLFFTDFILKNKTLQRQDIFLFKEKENRCSILNKKFQKCRKTNLANFRKRK